MPIFKPKEKKFIIATADYSGYGFTKIITEEGYDALLAFKYLDEAEPKDIEVYEKIGEGVIEKVPLDDLMDKRYQFRDWYWIFDQNYLPEESEKLKKEGFKVLGGGKLSHQLENDRKLGADVVKKYGFALPETKEFSSIEEGLAFLDENPEKAYVYKPDGRTEAHTTYVPDNEDDEEAHEELYRYMESLTEDETYILQERVKGVEANIEVWFYKGKPYFALCDLESKRKYSKDEGELVGCAQDIVFTIPLNCKLVSETIGKLFPFYESFKYTGFSDATVIISDHKIYFLEFCNRFGYNCHPNLFLNLAIDPLGEILSLIHI